MILQYYNITKSQNHKITHRLNNNAQNNNIVHCGIFETVTLDYFV